LQEAITTFQQQGQPLQQAVTLSNLALTYQQLGNWPAANQAIAQSLDLLQAAPVTSRIRQSLLAQVLNVKGGLQLAQGQSEQALATWEQVATLYQALGDHVAVIRSRLNQAEALQTLGLYRRAVTLLTDLNQTLQAQPDSPIKVVALRSLGDALQIVGNLDQSYQTLQQSLTLAQRLQLPEAIAEIQLSLGNTTRAQAIDHQAKNEDSQAQANLQVALTFYQQAAASPSPLTQTQAQLNQISLLIETQQEAAVQPLISAVQQQIDRLPLSRPTIYARINLAHSLLQSYTHSKISAPSSTSAQLALIAQLLTTASQQAKQLQDPRAEASALGQLGGLYEQTQQWSIAQTLTQEALLLAQAANASDIAYQWQWQLGRLLKAQGDRTGAIAAYSQAVELLQTLRSDLVAINQDVQFSFREAVEPVYRQLVDLLLQPTQAGRVNQADLHQARSVMESLQIAELDNFFREACLDARFNLDQVVDQDHLAVAIFYPIILRDRLEIILKLPQQDLQHYTVSVSQEQLEHTLDQLRQQLTAPYTFRQLQAMAHEVYTWLVQPAIEALKANQVNTLVFVPDGALRNIPMAALYDGQHYLIEQYSIALAPGLQLFKPRPLAQNRIQALIAGLSEARHGFTPLSYVETEVQEIKSEVPSVVLLNRAFTEATFQQEINTFSFPIVHIATHGQFSSNADQTFILAWDNPINVNQLDTLLRSQDQEQTGAIELLVLSACQTAKGDRRAALGLAGVAIRAGARSTLASLWSLDDASGAVLMSEFYRQLTTTTLTKAEALRQAQLKLLSDPQYRHPRYWSPYVLVGNWL
jgi:CHAT domain-containing protein